MFALVADGTNGFAVVQLISPDTVPGYQGFSPRPAPKLIARYPIAHGEANSISRGLDRDRVVDETGNQTVVFGRRGSRPFHLDEMKKFYQHADGTPYRVADEIRGNPLPFPEPASSATPAPPPRQRLLRRDQ